MRSRCVVVNPESRGIIAGMSGLIPGADFDNPFPPPEDLTTTQDAIRRSSADAGHLAKRLRDMLASYSEEQVVIGGKTYTILAQDDGGALQYDHPWQVQIVPVTTGGSTKYEIRVNPDSRLYKWDGTEYTVTINDPVKDDAEDGDIVFIKGLFEDGVLDTFSVSADPDELDLSQAFWAENSRAEKEGATGSGEGYEPGDQTLFRFPLARITGSSGDFTIEHFVQNDLMMQVFLYQGFPLQFPGTF